MRRGKRCFISQELLLSRPGCPDATTTQSKALQKASTKVMYFKICQVVDHLVKKKKCGHSIQTAAFLLLSIGYLEMFDEFGVVGTWNWLTDVEQGHCFTPVRISL